MPFADPQISLKKKADALKAASDRKAAAVKAWQDALAMKGVDRKTRTALWESEKLLEEAGITGKELEALKDTQYRGGSFAGVEFQPTKGALSEAGRRTTTLKKEIASLPKVESGAAGAPGASSAPAPKATLPSTPKRDQLLADIGAIDEAQKDAQNAPVAPAAPAPPKQELRPPTTDERKANYPAEPGIKYSNEDLAKKDVYAKARTAGESDQKAYETASKPMAPSNDVRGAQMRRAYNRAIEQGKSKNEAYDYARKQIYAGVDSTQPDRAANWEARFGADTYSTSSRSDQQKKGEMTPSGWESWAPIGDGDRSRKVLSLPPLELSRENALTRAFGEGMRLKRDAGGQAAETPDQLLQRRREIVQGSIHGAPAPAKVETDLDSGTRTIRDVSGKVVGTASNPAWASPNRIVGQNIRMPVTNPNPLPVSEDVWNPQIAQNKIDDKGYLGEIFTENVDMAQRGVAGMVRSTGLPPVSNNGLLVKKPAKLPKYNF